eukprot:TRINITY_DN1507_c0_g1_i1.p1 TRINITY_DN1507_c0_g1~~TRINITY_DN1507_c0_g1_i1.p1  ORF type:complete len:502 (+),score=136.64 TRINITY_DN1507_c0_g1_i1:505-2010(+)
MEKSKIKSRLRSHLRMNHVEGVEGLRNCVGGSELNGSECRMSTSTTEQDYDQFGTFVLKDSGSEIQCSTEQSSECPFVYRAPDSWELSLISLEKGEWSAYMSEDAFRKYKKERGSLFTVFQEDQDTSGDPSSFRRSKSLSSLPGNATERKLRRRYGKPCSPPPEASEVAPQPALPPAGALSFAQQNDMTPPHTSSSDNTPKSLPKSLPKSQTEKEDWASNKPRMLGQRKCVSSQEVDELPPAKGPFSRSALLTPSTLPLHHKKGIRKSKTKKASLDNNTTIDSKFLFPKPSNEGNRSPRDSKKSPRGGKAKREKLSEGEALKKSSEGEAWKKSEGEALRAPSPRQSKERKMPLLKLPGDKKEESASRSSRKEESASKSSRHRRLTESATDKSPRHKLEKSPRELDHSLKAEKSPKDLSKTLKTPTHLSALQQDKATRERSPKEKKTKTSLGPNKNPSDPSKISKLKLPPTPLSTSLASILTSPMSSPRRRKLQKEHKTGNK